MDLIIGKAVMIAVVGMVILCLAFPETVLTAISKSLVNLRERWRKHLIRKYGVRIANAWYQEVFKTLRQEGWSKTDIESAYQIIRDQQAEELGSEHVQRLWPRALLDHWLR